MKSPGHEQHPDHKVDEIRVKDTVTVEIAGKPVVESDDVIRVEETGHPPRHYFPMTAIDARLDESDKTSECPFKGKASYYNVTVGDRTFEDAAWTYEQPYDEHRDLAGRVAFYDEKVDQISIH